MMNVPPRIDNDRNGRSTLGRFGIEVHRLAQRSIIAQEGCQTLDTHAEWARDPGTVSSTMRRQESERRILGGSSSAGRNACRVECSVTVDADGWTLLRLQN